MHASVARVLSEIVVVDAAGRVGKVLIFGVCGVFG
jgi:hypothetical protein